MDSRDEATTTEEEEEEEMEYRRLDEPTSTTMKVTKAKRRQADATIEAGERKAEHPKLVDLEIETVSKQDQSKETEESQLSAQVVVNPNQSQQQLQSEDDRNLDDDGNLQERFHLQEEQVEEMISERDEVIQGEEEKTSDAIISNEQDEEDDEMMDRISKLIQLDAAQTTEGIELHNIDQRPTVVTTFSSSSYLRLDHAHSLEISIQKMCGFYDEGNEALILLNKRKGEFQVYDLNGQTNPLKFRFQGEVIDVKLSPSHMSNRYAAVLTKDAKPEAVLLNLETNLEMRLKPKTKDALILSGGVLWIGHQPLTPNQPSVSSSPNQPSSPTQGQSPSVPSIHSPSPIQSSHSQTPSSTSQSQGQSPNRGQSQSQAPGQQVKCLCLVTNKGVETYELNKGVINNIQRISLAVKSHLSLPSRRLVCCLTEDNELVPLHFPQVSAASVVKWPGVKLENRQQSIGEAAVVDCYEEALFLSIRSREVSVFRLSPLKAERIRVLRTVEGPLMGISFVDSLILIHSAHASVSLVYDVRSDDMAIVHPLPIDCSSALTSSPSKMKPYAATWQFFPSKWLLDAKQNRVWQLDLDLFSMTRAFSNGDDVYKLVEFLMRRKQGNAKEVLVRLVLALIRGTRSEYITSELLAWIRALVDHCQFVDTTKWVFPPEEFVADVLDQIVSDSTSLSLAASVCLEYISRFVSKWKPASQDSNLALLFSRASLLLSASGRSTELYQLFLRQTGPDGEEAVQALQSIGGREYRQVALDCLHRMGRHLDQVHELIKEGAFNRALKLALMKRMLSDDSVVIQLLRACDGRVDRFCLLRDALKQQSHDDERCGEWLSGKLRSVPDVDVPVQVCAAFGLLSSS